jgi:hypothetical protein
MVFRPESDTPATTLNLIKKEISLLNQAHHDIILQICNEQKLIGRRHPGAVWVKSVKLQTTLDRVVVFNFPDDENLAFGTVAKEFVRRMEGASRQSIFRSLIFSAF